MSETIYEHGLGQNPANYQALTPLTFLQRCAGVHPEHTAVIHGNQRFDYARFHQRTLRLASALAAQGIGTGDTVSVILSNTPPMLEAHYGVPMTGGVLNALNTRLDAPTIAFILDHAETKVLITDREFAPAVKRALELAEVQPYVIDYDDPEFAQDGALLGAIEYEDFLAKGSPDYVWKKPDDEWQAISLSYTSGTTGNPKGVVYHHRGAYLMGFANVIAAGMTPHPVYLWTLPLFHCNGWCFSWSLSVVAGTHVCLRQVRADAIYSALAKHEVTHLCGAPVVMATLLNAPEDQRHELPHRVRFVTAAAPPPEAVLSGMRDAGFDVTHVYGLTETYGPAVVNEWKSRWDTLTGDETAAKTARQGVRYPALEDVTIMDADTMTRVPHDGETLGEVMFRGNIVMKGYLKNASATAEAFAGGWFHSGDLGVVHRDGYIQLKDRSKDVIISGGETISSIEIEDILYKHPDVQAAAVVAKPDDKWGETPCAFIEIKPGAKVAEDDIIAFCRDNLAHFKCPSLVVFAQLPKTSTGKIQKFKLRAEIKNLERSSSRK